MEWTEQGATVVGAFAVESFAVEATAASASTERASGEEAGVAERAGGGGASSEEGANACDGEPVQRALWGAVRHMRGIHLCCASSKGTKMATTMMA